MRNINFKKLPKVELHVHLDCSLSYDVVSKIDPSVSLKEYEATFVLPPKCLDLVEYIYIVAQGSRLMQTREALELVTQDLFDQFADDGVIYAEIRFAPHLHLQQGLTSREVVQIVNDEVERSITRTGVEVNVILCTLRHYSESESMETVKIVEEFKGSRVVGFDIAADEAGHPLTNHLAAFKYARDHDISITAHAGEARGAESIWETLEQLKVSRIGHGVRCIEDAELMSHLKDTGIHLEVCPTSNVCTDTVPTLEDHPIDQLYNKDISLSISTDARGFQQLTLVEEYQKLTDQFDWDAHHFMTCNLAAINHAFTNPEMKDRLRAQIQSAYEGLIE